jgi:Fur family peroxide stress response transcriptional regulator
MKGPKGKRSDVVLTRRRRLVLEAIHASAKHLTAFEIYETARKVLPTISFATVYNSLRYLKKAGLITEIPFSNAASRYDSKTARHDHAICSSCGKLVDFNFPQAVELMKKAARHCHFKPESIHLILRGLCPD